VAESLVIVLRVASLLAFAAPMWLTFRGRRPAPRAGARQGRGGSAPVVANVTACAVFYPCLLASSGALEGRAALLLALTGCVLAVAGVTVVLRSRRELGAAWRLVPGADEATGLVTTGPYRLVRHPIYLGLSMLALGQALAFASPPAFVVLLTGVIPTFVWRAVAEERLLAATFGTRYALYQSETTLIIPRLL
jgi:protein-S-isoprenylcysteine O-methyltransferase Ste14